ncbi:MAG: ABC transporter ATP-binding protein [Acidimicrobiia bacterium]
MLQVTNLTKTFQSGDSKVTAVDNVSFTAPDGRFAAVVGRSGSGKSTLLSLLGGLDKPTSGTIDVDGTVISSGSDRQLIQYRRNRVGFVFQSYNLIPNLSAVENVMLPMEFAGISRNDRRARAVELLDQVELNDNKQDRRPGKLSGGEQQRVAIARALANHPKLILADEPTGNLDRKTGNAIFSLLHGLARSENTTIIVVTHDLSIAGRTDLTFEMEDGSLTTTDAGVVASS